MGVDISETAIKKARIKYPQIEFLSTDIRSFLLDIENKRFDMVLALEILSYLENWEDIVEKVSKISNFLLISLYLPTKPIGFIKTFDELLDVTCKYFVVETKILLNDMEMILLLKSKEG